MGDVDLGAIVRYEGKLVEVVAWFDGPGRQFILRPVSHSRCPTCGSSGDIHVAEHSLLWEQNAEPVKTLKSVRQGALS